MIKSAGFIVPRNRYESYYFIDAKCNSRNSLLFIKFPKDIQAKFIAFSSTRGGEEVPVMNGIIYARVIDPKAFTINAELIYVKKQKFGWSDMK